ncbi:hypothetical protein [Methylorubrum extorquens]
MGQFDRLWEIDDTVSLIEMSDRSRPYAGRTKSGLMRGYLKGRISSVKPRTVTILMKASFVATLALPCGVASALILISIPVALLSIMVFPVAFAFIYLVMLFGVTIVGAVLGLLALNIFISYVVLPITAVILPTNYWMQQFGLLASGTGIAFLMASAASASIGWGVAGAIGGLIASAAFGKCVKDLWI